MLKIRIHGIKDGESDFILEDSISNLPDLPEEFFGNVLVEGKLTKIGKRYTVIGNAKCNANLICDISLEEYIEEINASFDYSFIVNNELYLLLKEKGEFENENGEIIVHEDDQFLDLTEEIRQELILNIPMKKVAPQYRDKDLSDIYPDLKIEEESDPRWSELKKLKF